jgi:hypothetical protein
VLPGPTGGLVLGPQGQPSIFGLGCTMYPKGDARMPADSCVRPSLQPLTPISTPSHLRKVEQPAVNREAHTESVLGFGDAASNGAEPNASIDGERAAAWGRDGLPKVKFFIAPRTSVLFCAPRANRPHFERGNP